MPFFLFNWSPANDGARFIARNSYSAKCGNRDTGAPIFRFHALALKPAAGDEVHLQGAQLAERVEDNKAFVSREYLQESAFRHSVFLHRLFNLFLGICQPFLQQNRGGINKRT